MTLFGMLADGMGSGLTHQPSIIMSMMDNAIKNDIDAQKESAKNQQTRWDMNYKHQLMAAEANGKDINNAHTLEQAKSVADLRTKMQYDRDYLHELSQKIKRMPEGPDKARQIEAYGVLSRATDANHINAADQWQGQNAILNGKFGVHPDDSIDNPHPSSLRPAPGYMPPRGASNNASSANSVLTADKSGSQETKKDESKPEKPVVYSLLAPDSGRRFRNIQADLDPIWSKSKGDISAQYTAADQAEKVLNGPKKDGVGGIHDLMQQMWTNSGQGGYGSGAPSHFRRTVEEGTDIPYVGPAIKAASDLFPRSDAQKQYAANATNMETDLSNALKGVMAPTDITRVVRANLPVYGDDKDMVARKEQNIVSMIKKALQTSSVGPKGARLIRGD